MSFQDCIIAISFAKYVVEICKDTEHIANYIKLTYIMYISQFRNNADMKFNSVVCNYTKQYINENNPWQLVLYTFLTHLIFKIYEVHTVIFPITQIGKQMHKVVTQLAS